MKRSVDATNPKVTLALPQHYPPKETPGLADLPCSRRACKRRGTVRPVPEKCAWI